MALAFVVLRLAALDELTAAVIPARLSPIEAVRVLPKQDGENDSQRDKDNGPQSAHPLMSRFGAFSGSMRSARRRRRAALRFS